MSSLSLMVISNTSWASHSLILVPSILWDPVLVRLLQHWQSHGPQSRLERQIRIVVQKTREEEPGQRVHWHRLWVNGDTESTRWSAVHHLDRAVLQHSHQEQVQVNVLQTSNQLILLFAHNVLGVQSLGHDPLLAQGQNSRLKSQCEVGLVLVLRVGHMDVLVLRWHDGGVGRICLWRWIIRIVIRVVVAIHWTTPDSVSIISSKTLERRQSIQIGHLLRSSSSSPIITQNTRLREAVKDAGHRIQWELHFTADGAVEAVVDAIRFPVGYHISQQRFCTGLPLMVGGHRIGR